MTNIKAIEQKAKEFKNQMKDLYATVNQNSSKAKIQQVCSQIDMFLCVNFQVNIDDFAEGKKTTMDGRKLTEEQVDAICQAFPYRDYPKVVLEWRKSKENDNPNERERERERDDFRFSQWQPGLSPGW